MTAGYSKKTNAQIISTPNYEVLAAPDLWYNEVDGVRVGFRLRGQEPGSFLDGDHRLDFGLWLGTRLPTYPVSYYLSFVEPIPGITEFGSEGSFNLFSSIREGLHHHGLGIDKRWQPGFNEFTFTEASGHITAHYRFEDDYAHYPVLWDDDVVIRALTRAERQTENRFGYSNITSSLSIGIPVETDFFTQFQTEVAQEFFFSRFFSFNARGFVAAATDYLPREYYHQTAQAPALDWTTSGFTRSRGTIPISWMDDGLVHVAGGANIRGYTAQNINASLNGQPALYSNITALNLELRYLNLLNSFFDEMSMVSEFLNLNSYLFYDIGAPFEDGFNTTLSDAGAGFMLSLNIPDYVGRQRGFNFRYEIPFWLSDPTGGDDSFELRHLLSIGAVIGI